MNKKGLLEKIIEKLEEERKALVEAAQHTYEAATHEESEAEDQYDTRGLEASYLAGAQAKRVEDIDKTILALRFINVRDFSSDDPIEATALVEVEHAGKNLHLFVLPVGGGISIDIENRHVQVVTPQSPLGEALIDCEVGDVALVEVGNQTHEYEIVSIS